MTGIKIPFGNLKRHYEAYKCEIDEAVSRVLASGWYLLGSELQAFERGFADYCGSRYAVGVASGTDAIEIALSACGVGCEDEVITVSNTCVPTITGIEATGAKPVFVDINPATHIMNAALIEGRISHKSKAIVVVQLYGQCAEMDQIITIARKYGLAVVEDCAQAAGAEYKGKKAGTIGDAAAFSFYPSKNLGALGDAGMVLTDNKAIFSKAEMLRNYGQKTRYEHLIKGGNSRMDELQASILSAKLPYLDKWNTRRREIAGYYMDMLSPLEVGLPIEAEGRKHVYHLFVIMIKNRELFMERMLNEGVQTAIHYPTPVHLQPAYSEYRSQRQFLKITEEQAEQLVSLPIYPELTDSEVEYVMQAVVAAINKTSPASPN